MGVARKASLSFEMGLLCIYAGTTTETAAVSSPPRGMKFVGIGIEATQTVLVSV